MDKQIVNGAYLLKDLIEGEESVSERDDFLRLSPTQIQKALEIIINNPKFSDDTKKYLIANTWAINYKAKPPTIEEIFEADYKLNPERFQTIALYQKKSS